jgi:signal transduction histidine kinase
MHDLHDGIMDGGAMDPRDRAWVEAVLDGMATPFVLASPRATRADLIFVNAAARRLSHDLLRSDGGDGSAVAIDLGYFTDPAGSQLAQAEMPASRAARGEAVDAMEVIWHAPFGVIPLVCFAERVPAAASLPSVVAVSLFDVSVAKGFERELLEEMQTRDEFISLVAHELRTPLASLRLRTQTLCKKNPDTPAIAAVERATSRLQDLVEHLLTAEQLRELGIRLEPERLDLCELVDEAIGRARAERHGGPFIARVGASELRGHWDRLRLQVVLELLIGNALRFGAGKPVGIECRDLGERVSVAVSDGGIGIDPVDHERIFRRFGRAVPSSHFGGLGLGLWMARRLVESMGGSIAVTSARGCGATFTVELPRGPRAYAVLPRLLA